MEPWTISKTIRNAVSYWQASSGCTDEGNAASPPFRTLSAVKAWCDRNGIPYKIDSQSVAYGPGQHMGGGRYAGLRS